MARKTLEQGGDLFHPGFGPRRYAGLQAQHFLDELPRFRLFGGAQPGQRGLLQGAELYLCPLPLAGDAFPVELFGQSRHGLMSGTEIPQ